MSNDRATATPLTGGVSCEIYLIKDGERRFVAKRALEKLRVKQDWFACTSRNLYEQRYLKYVGQRFPHYVPKILHALEQERLFVMEYFPEQFKDWKKYLMKRKLDAQVSHQIATALADIHLVSWRDREAIDLFDSDENFHQLRLSPYFESLKARYPTLSPLIAQTCKEVAETKYCLVHGDFSPKNILVAGQKIKVVDCEVAWYGDPAFDVAFMLHHLLLKSHHFNDPNYLVLASDFVNTYRDVLGEEKFDLVDEKRVAKLTLLMALARVDGKSPVEYLSQYQQQSVREWCCSAIEKQQFNLETILNGVKSHEHCFN
ncbi:phosphotransferase family protein [Vibrio sp. WXL103]|uniref:phosphotransferase family protein n=1 Tax=unclassified Vibrio TaxID=2614977 RepID=UPI003EC5C9B3